MGWGEVREGCTISRHLENTVLDQGHTKVPICEV